MRVIPALPPRHLDPQAKTFWPLPRVLWQVYRMLLAASTSHFPAAPLCRTAELAATIEQGVFTASAIIPTTGLRMSQPIFPDAPCASYRSISRFWLQSEPFFLHKFSTVMHCCKGRFALRVPPFFASLQNGNHPCCLQLITTALLIVRKNRASAHKSNFKISQIWHAKLKNQPRTSQQTLPPQSKQQLPQLPSSSSQPASSTAGTSISRA